jgi:hypothetical protein
VRRSVLRRLEAGCDGVESKSAWLCRGSRRKKWSRHKGACSAELAGDHASDKSGLVPPTSSFTAKVALGNSKGVGVGE